MTDIFGVYNIRSRISVGLVVLAPLLIQAYMLIPEVRNISRKPLKQGQQKSVNTLPRNYRT